MIISEKIGAAAGRLAWPVRPRRAFARAARTPSLKIAAAIRLGKKILFVASQMWALLLAAPPKWTTSKAPGCTPKDPSGRDMGCSNNPSTLTFHKDAIPHVPQEFIQSPACRRGGTASRC